MRKLWKAGISLMLAMSMGAGSIPVTAQAVNSQTSETKEKRKTTISQEEPYAEGEAIILYNSSKMNLVKNSATGTIDDIEIVQSYDFDITTPTSKARANGTQTTNGLSVSLVKSDKHTTDELIEILSKRSDIKYVEPNYRIKVADITIDTDTDDLADSAPDATTESASDAITDSATDATTDSASDAATASTTDPYKIYQWALDNKGQNNGTEGLDINDNSLLHKDADEEERVIALIDTGIDYTHEDLADAIWVNPVESKQLKGKHGYDFINSDEDPMDDNGHGSHCSGIMAATAGNDTGIAGVATSDNIKIMGLKILDANGMGYGMEAIGAYNYIYKAQQMGVNVVAINNSWGGVGDESDIFEELINLVGENGAISVCAAGNEALDNDVEESLPANIDSPYVISVAATNEKDELATFSNYGAKNVDIAAPGTNILSSVSYNCFNPSIYEKPDELCSFMQDFSTGKLVETIAEDSYTDAVASEGDISYGYCSFGGKAELSIELTDKTYFGPKEEGAKSLQWNIKGAKKNEQYYLYLPYTVQENNADSYVSVMTKISGPSGIDELDPYDWFAMPSSVFIGESTIDETGTYVELTENGIAETFIDYDNYWNHFSGELSKSVKKGDTRALAIQIFTAADGDYTVNIDNFGISKPGISEEQFGKYEFYNGTSMATPHVTGAVAAIANAYPEESPIDVKARVLGSKRSSESLQGKTTTGGVLDLSKSASPNMSIEEAVLTEDNRIEITGYYLDKSTVTVNDKEVKILEQTDDTITIDGSNYINKAITIKLAKENDSISSQYFFMTGESFEEGTEFGGYLSGGNVTSGGNRIYYTNESGQVYIGTPAISGEDTALSKAATTTSDKDNLITDDESIIVNEDINISDEDISLPDTDKKTLTWKTQLASYSADIFGENYEHSVNAALTSQTDVVYGNDSLWTILKIDVGFSEDKALVCYNEDHGWSMMSYLPKELENVEGYTLAFYNNSLYLLGGYDTATHKCSTLVYQYDTDKKAWETASALPEGRVYAKGLQVGNKLIVTLGGNTNGIANKNLIFDGKVWSVSKAALGTCVDTVSYTFEKDTESETVIDVATAQIGLVANGIIYTDCRVENLGDTFIYNVSKDAYDSTGYVLDKESLYFDNLYATTIENELYVLYGFDEDDFYEDWMAVKKNSSYDEEPGDEFEDEYGDELGDEYTEEFEDYFGAENLYDSYINILTMPVETGFVNVVDNSDDGAFVTNSGYHIPGDTICLTASAIDENHFVKGMTVNGEAVKEASSVFSKMLTIPMDAKELTVAAQAGAYVTKVIIPETMTLKPGESVLLTATVLPQNADNKTLLWSSKDETIVTIDANGTVTAAEDAEAGTEVIICATAEDREILSFNCTIIIENDNISDKDETSSGSDKVETPSDSDKTEAPSDSDKTDTPSDSDKTEAPSDSDKTETPSDSDKTETPSDSDKTEAPSDSDKTEAPSDSDKTDTPSGSDKDKTPSTSDQTDTSKDPSGATTDNTSLPVQDVTVATGTNTQTNGTSQTPTDNQTATNNQAAAGNQITGNIPTISDHSETNNSLTTGNKVTTGNATYKVLTNTDKSKTVLFVSWNNKKVKKATVPATIKVDNTTFKVTDIAANAFKNCKELKTITIGKNVTSIGKNAFKGCKKLNTITVKSSKLKKVASNKTSTEITIKVPKKVKNNYTKLFQKAGLNGILK